MPTRMFGFRGTGSIAASTTIYWMIGDCFLGGPSITTETDAKIPWSVASTFSQMFMFIQANNRATSTARFRVNGANGNQVLSIGGTGIFEDTTNVDVVPPGAGINYSITTGAGGSSFVITTAAITSSALVMKYGSGDPHTIASSNTYFAALSDDIQSTTSEARVQVKFRTRGVLKRLWTWVSSTSTNPASTMRSRINGVNGNLLLTLPVATTGAFEDVTNQDQIQHGDLVNLTHVAQGAQTTLTRAVECHYDPRLSTYMHVAGQSNTQTFNANTTQYVSLGSFIGTTTTETNAQGRNRVAERLSNLQVYVFANTVTATSTVRTRKNSANGSQSVSIGSSATGLFEDTTNVDELLPTDLINTQIVTGATGTTLTLTQILLLAMDQAAHQKFYPGKRPHPFKPASGAGFRR